MHKKDEDMMRTPGFPLRIAISIVTFSGWIVFVIWWLFFLADTFTLYQNIAIFVASILVAVGVLAAAWVSWGIKYGWKHGGECCPHCAEYKKTKTKARKTPAKRRTRRK